MHLCNSSYCHSPAPYKCFTDLNGSLQRKYFPSLEVKKESDTQRFRQGWVCYNIMYLHVDTQGPPIRYTFITLTHKKKSEERWPGLWDTFT